MFNHVSTPLLPKLKVDQVAGKRYYITPEGVKYPSITTVLGHQEKPWLTNWRNILGDKKADKEIQRTATRGEEIHKLIEKYLNNETDFTKGVKLEYIQGFNQVKFHLNHINNIRTQEQNLYSKQLGVAGRVDCIGEYKGVLSVIDFKTSNNNKDEQMTNDFFLQCTGYAIMWHEQTNDPVENIVVIMTIERGVVPLVFVKNIDKYVKPLLKRIHDFKRNFDK